MGSVSGLPAKADQYDVQLGVVINHSHRLKIKCSLVQPLIQLMYHYIHKLGTAV